MATIQFKSASFNQAVAQTPAVKDAEEKKNVATTDAAQGADKKVNAPLLTPQQIEANMSSRDRINSQIVESIRVSMGAEEKPLDLLYKTAVDEINKILGNAYAVDGVAVDGYLQQQMQEDNSSQATANRILSFSLGLFPAYAAQNPELEGEALAQKFIDVIRGGFETGYNEAAKILEGLSVFDGSIKKDIEETHRLVMEGFDAFIQQAGKGTTETTEASE